MVVGTKLFDLVTSTSPASSGFVDFSQIATVAVEKSKSPPKRPTSGLQNKDEELRRDLDAKKRAANREKYAPVQLTKAQQATRAKKEKSNLPQLGCALLDLFQEKASGFNANRPKSGGLKQPGDEKGDTVDVDEEPELQRAISSSTQDSKTPWKGLPPKLSTVLEQEKQKSLARKAEGGRSLAPDKNVFRDNSAQTYQNGIERGTRRGSIKAALDHKRKTSVSDIELKITRQTSSCPVSRQVSGHPMGRQVSGMSRQVSGRQISKGSKGSGEDNSAAEQIPVKKFLKRGARSAHEAAAMAASMVKREAVTKFLAEPSEDTPRSVGKGGAQGKGSSPRKNDDGRPKSALSSKRKVTMPSVPTTPSAGTPDNKKVQLTLPVMVRGGTANPDEEELGSPEMSPLAEEEESLLVSGDEGAEEDAATDGRASVTPSFTPASTRPGSAMTAASRPGSARPTSAASSAMRGTRRIPTAGAAFQKRSEGKRGTDSTLSLSPRSPVFDFDPEDFSDEDERREAAALRDSWVTNRDEEDSDRASDNTEDEAPRKHSRKNTREKTSKRPAPKLLSRECTRKKLQTRLTQGSLTKGKSRRRGRNKTGGSTNSSLGSFMDRDDDDDEDDEDEDSESGSDESGDSSESETSRSSRMSRSSRLTAESQSSRSSRLSTANSVRDRRHREMRRRSGSMLSEKSGASEPSDGASNAGSEAEAKKMRKKKAAKVNLDLQPISEATTVSRGSPKNSKKGKDKEKERSGSVVSRKTAIAKDLQGLDFRQYIRKADNRTEAAPFPSAQASPVKFEVRLWSSQRDGNRHAASNLMGEVKGKSNVAASQKNWESDGPAPQWLLLDLGKEELLSGLRLRCPGGQGTPQDLQILRSSTDSPTGPWVPVARVLLADAAGNQPKNPRHLIGFNGTRPSRFWKLIFHETWTPGDFVSVLSPLVLLAEPPQEAAECKTDVEQKIEKQNDNLEMTVLFAEDLNIGPDEREVRKLARDNNMPLEHAEVIWKEFKKFDATGLGSVGFDDFVVVVNSVLGVKDSKGLMGIPEKRLGKLWQEVDIDGKGRVDFADFTLWFFEHFLKKDQLVESSHSERAADSASERFYASFGMNRLMLREVLTRKRKAQVPQGRRQLSPSNSENDFKTGTN
eukprot:TRINITY_DN33877_c0_g1_i1.p1 TRINITY_DN33877_c0_g1~~TRINITY_DN33877_c0_g1_i1.p1  ORF type:complete len:1136 (-),score=267.63 TRINITY_DN33877_c0_g1_i1:59-3466(-)